MILVELMDGLISVAHWVDFSDSLERVEGLEGLDLAAIGRHWPRIEGVAN
jgi:hypothetical protein